MRAQRQDANAGVIDAGLRAIGASVENLPGGNGRPDRLVGFHGETFLFEYKREGRKGKRSINPQTFDRQKSWRESWRGRPPVIVESLTEALEALGIPRRGAA